MNPLNQLAELGQAFWYDNIQRSLLKNGTTETLQREGVTTFAQSFDNLLKGLVAKSREAIPESAD